ncbi:MAG TPA: tetratricopeptide repeat protein [Clostridia bacterium]|nr:tetratricopeptide repeat protein [Clostridia bacterium]
MFSFFGLGFFGLLIVGTALVHFSVRRPDTFWLWVILFAFPPIGAFVYLAVEALPELRDPGTFKFVQRRSRQKELEYAVQDNPSAGNYEELGQIYLDEGRWRQARECFDRAISQRKDSPDPFYRRAIAELQLGDVAAAKADLEGVITKDRGYDFHRAAGLLAHAYALSGEPEKASALFADVLRISTLTETQLHYAEFLAAQGRKAEAREWTQRILAKRATMPGFLKRRERPLFRQANALLRTL